MKNNLLTLSVAASTLFAVSCVSSKTPSLGGKIESEGNAVAEIGESWKKGESMIKKGEKMIKDGQQKKEKAEKAFKTKTLNS